MQRRKYPYTEWEDYVAGLYALTWEGTQRDAMELLSDPGRLRSGMHQALALWPKASEHHLSDDAVNSRAWLGWAACGILARVPAHATRAAWWLLSEDQRVAANAVADDVIRYYMGARLF
jgi:hypothetical protein